MRTDGGDTEEGHDDVARGDEEHEEGDSEADRDTGECHLNNKKKVQGITISRSLSLHIYIYIEIPVRAICRKGSRRDHYIYIYIHIHIYTYVCVCACICIYMIVDMPFLERLWHARVVSSVFVNEPAMKHKYITHLCLCMHLCGVGCIDIGR